MRLTAQEKRVISVSVGMTVFFTVMIGLTSHSLVAALETLAVCVVLCGLVALALHQVEIAKHKDDHSSRE